MSLSLSRDTKLYVSTVDAGWNDSNTWEILIGEDYSYSQGIANTDITVDEAGPAPTRGSARYNDSLDPVDWNFSTYIRPMVEDIAATDYHTIADKIMWHALVTASAVDFTDSGSAVYGDADTATPGEAFHVDFTERNVHELSKLNLYFVVKNKTYLVKQAQVGQAEISIDINDIAMVTWTGQGTELVGLLDGEAPDFAGIATPNYAADYIKNKLTVMDLTADYLGTGDKDYDVPLLSGTITINNNITYLTPSTLSIVDKPIGSFTGALEVTGSFSAYVRDKVGGLGSFDLWRDLLSTNALAQTQTQADLTFYVGGKVAPVAVFKFPQAMLTVPTINPSDLVEASVDFKALPTELENTDEGSLEFFNSTGAIA